jgi:hypothetical protein
MMQYASGSVLARERPIHIMAASFVYGDSSVFFNLILKATMGVSLWERREAAQTNSYKLV